MPVRITREEFDKKFGQSSSSNQEIVKAAAQDAGLPGFRSLSKPSDLRQDFVEFGKNVANKFRGRTEQLGEDIARRQSDGDYTLREKVGTGLGFAAGTVGAGIDTFNEGLKLGAKALLTQEQEDYISGGLKSTGERLTENTINHPVLGPIATSAIDEASQIVSSYNEWAIEHPEAAANVRDTGTMAEAIVELLATKGGLSASRHGVDLAKDAVKKTAPKIDELVELRRKATFDRQLNKANEATGKIIQGKTDDIDPARRALTGLDTKGVKTYDELNTRISGKVTSLAEEQSNYLSQFDQKFTTEQLGRFEKAGERTVISTPVQDALEQMKTFYKKTSQAGKEAEVDQLIEKMKGEGLTLSEINKIAIDHGQNLNAFNVSGELASGLPRQSAENTRKGLKDVLRERLPDDYSKDLDSQMSDLLGTERLTAKMSEKVNSIQQRIVDRSLAQKFGSLIFTTLDLASFRTLGGFTSRFGHQSVAKFPTGNAIEIEQQLQKNLKELDKLAAIKEQKAFSKAVEDYVNNLQPGLSIQAVDGKADRVIKWVENGKSQSQRVAPDAVQGFTNTLDKKGIKYQVTTP